MPKTFTATATLVGTAIGAGILGIPYVIMKSGFGFGLLNMLIVLIIVLTTILYLGEIALRTKKNLHLAGYAEKYLGKIGKKIMFIAFIFGIYSALVAYLIGEGESLSQLLFNNAQYSFQFGIAFWLVLSAMTYYGLKALKHGEKIGFTVIIILMVFIIAMFWNKINISNLTYNNTNFFFAPFGVVLFAFLSFSAIPEVKKILEKEKKNLKKTIFYAYAIIFIIYFIFTAIVLGTEGANTPEIATISLGKIFILLGMLAMATSYLALTTALADMLNFDFKKRKHSAWLTAILPPILIFIIISLTKIATFTKILGLGGVLSGGIVGILILLMIKKAKFKNDCKPEYSIPYSKLISIPIIIIIIIGTIFEIINFF